MILFDMNQKVEKNDRSISIASLEFFLGNLKRLLDIRDVAHRDGWTNVFLHSCVKKLEIYNISLRYNVTLRKKLCKQTDETLALCELKRHKESSASDPTNKTTKPLLRYSVIIG